METNVLSTLSLGELFEIERVYGVRLALPIAVRRRLDAYWAQPRQLSLVVGA